ncbi:flagellar motor switch protein FliG [Cognatishimia sp. F0-27]|uniref:flagellar motor switch protein FliG n=1 Tax=Cognatishimia sp. F0-27 TaxID=2816855 RepID=UPI001D0C53DD|nr:FliG C-terminal domain-containing protein [Cognatishimia sp. F0-27]MCC1492584.1 flagellar motor switch protein FliG [Cognatishimia sp. F0-27]
MLPAPTPLPPPARISGPDGLSRKAKAAIIVQFLLNEGADVPLASLEEELQAELTLLLGNMRYVDRNTLNAVVREFADELDGVGLSFPGNMANALTALDGKISTRTAQRLRKEAGVRQTGDPWVRINGLEVEKLVDLVQSESTEVAAVMMSKIDVAKAAKVLGALPGDRARRISFAVSMTASVTPDAVDRIGISLAAQLDAEPLKAFKSKPNERLGAILNYSASDKRDELLGSLEEQDAHFADSVRKAIFTFANIPTRMKEVDVPKIMRDVPQDVIALCVAAAASDEEVAAVDFILSNSSKRLATAIKEEADQLGEVSGRKADRAMAQVVSAIRALVDNGEIELRQPDDEEDG